MFGSNFFGNFGIPDFGYQNADPQGGLFGTNTPPDPSQNAAPAAAPSPLAGGPLAPGGGQPPQEPGATPGVSQPPPAAGIASPFGKPGL